MKKKLGNLDNQFEKYSKKPSNPLCKWYSLDISQSGDMPFDIIILVLWSISLGILSKICQTSPL